MDYHDAALEHRLAARCATGGSLPCSESRWRTLQNRTEQTETLVLVESLAHVFSTGKSANDLANPPTDHGGFATPETFHLKEVLDDRRICQVGISDLANPRGPENMGERFDQDQRNPVVSI